jgi:hypothetical protein
VKPPSSGGPYLLSTFSFLESKKLQAENHIFRFLNSIAGESSGKLYVTNSDFSSDIGRLCVIILHLFFPSVKPLPVITESIELRFFLENPFAESPPSLCNNPFAL